MTQSTFGSSPDSLLEQVEIMLLYFDTDPDHSTVHIEVQAMLLCASINSMPCFRRMPCEGILQTDVVRTVGEDPLLLLACDA